LISQLVSKLKDKLVADMNVQQCSRKGLLIAHLDSLAHSSSPVHLVSMIKKESLKNLAEDCVVLDHKNA